MVCVVSIFFKVDNCSFVMFVFSGIKFAFETNKSPVNVVVPVKVFAPEIVCSDVKST